MKKRVILGFLCIILAMSQFTLVTNADRSNAVTCLSVGEHYSLAVFKDNSLWGWGYDNGVYLGLRYSGKAAVVKPAKIMDNVVFASAGWGNALAIKTDKTLWAWGDNMPGVGEERITYALKPEKVMDDVISASSGDWFIVAVKSDGSLWSWGDNAGLKLDPKLIIKDKATNRGVVVKPVVQPIKLMDGVNKVVADNNAFCALKKDGTLLMINGSVSGKSKVKVGDKEYKVLSTGVKDVFMTAGTVYYLKNDDTLWGVGKKVYEDLCRYDLNKSNSYDYTPIKVMDGVKAAAVSDALPMLALKKDGTLVTWGMGGTLDMTFTKNSIDPFNFEKYKSFVLMQDVSQISAGSFQYLIGKNDGTVWTWGISLPMDARDAGITTSNFGSKDFTQLEFSDAEEHLFTTGEQKSKLLSAWVNDKEASGEIPAYDPGYKADWLGYWDDSVIKGMHFEKAGNFYYCYDVWDSFTFVAAADGNRLKGRMSGMIFDIRMLPDGSSFAGVLYQNSAAEAEVWTGKRVK